MKKTASLITAALIGSILTFSITGTLPAAQAEQDAKPVTNRRIALDWAWPRVKECKFPDDKYCRWDAEIRSGSDVSYLNFNGVKYNMPWKDRD